MKQVSSNNNSLKKQRILLSVFTVVTLTLVACLVAALSRPEPMIPPQLAKAAVEDRAIKHCLVNKPSGIDCSKIRTEITHTFNPDGFCRGCSIGSYYNISVTIGEGKISITYSSKVDGVTGELSDATYSPRDFTEEKF